MRRTPISRRMSTTRRASTTRMKSARTVLEERSAGNCEICGQVLTASPSGFDFQMHHRLSRARGGGDEVANLTACHPTCHARVHSRVTVATDCGWVLASGAIPEATSLIYQHQPAFLTDDGRVLFIDPFDEVSDPDADFDAYTDQNGGAA